MGKRRRTPAAFSNPVLSTDTHARLARSLSAAPSPAPAARQRVVVDAGEVDEAELWNQAIEGATPLSSLFRNVVLAAPAPLGPSQGSAVDPDAEAISALSRFVGGEGVFDIADQDEFVEGCWRGLDGRIMKRLRAGEFSLQDYVDLHGMVVEEAHQALLTFIHTSRLHGRRCVLVVHGRGRHSKDRIPVLKERTVQWLSRGRLAREVLAFCTARPHDGGAGALYVLLKRGGEQRPREERRRGLARHPGD